MIESLVLEAAAAAGLIWVAVGFARRPAPQPSLGSWIRLLRRRHRRAARAIIEMAREHDARHAKGSVEAYTARETLRSYLPETIAAYLAVPPALREVRRPGGLSPDEELTRQLRTLRHGLEAQEEADAASAAARMAENGAFLRERFGAPPPQPAEAPARVGDIVDALSAYLRRT